MIDDNAILYCFKLFKKGIVYLDFEADEEKWEEKQDWDKERRKLKVGELRTPQTLTTGKKGLMDFWL